MKDVAIIAYQQGDCVRNAGAQNEVELIMPVIGAVMKQAGKNKNTTCGAPKKVKFLKNWPSRAGLSSRAIPRAVYMALAAPICRSR